MPKVPFNERLDTYLHWEEWTIRDQSIEREVMVDPHIDQRLVLFVGAGVSVPAIELFTPNGHRVRPVDEERALFRQLDRAVSCQVGMPQAGEWRVRIVPQGSDSQRVLFAVSGRGKDNVFLKVHAQAVRLTADQREADPRYADLPEWFLHVRASFRGRYLYGIGNAAVVCSILDPLEKEHQVVLQDDGRQTDQRAGDGTYSAVLQIDATGEYLVRVRASGKNARSLEAKDVPDFFETGPPRHYESEDLPPFSRVAEVRVQAK